MSSHRSAGPGIDQYVSSPVAGLPPPPPRTGDGHRASDALRRGSGSRLPALTTNLVPGHSGQVPPTPLSTVSLSSPFVQHSQTPYSPVPGSSSRGPSPMAGRGYNVPYNPSEWALGNRQPSQSETVDPENGITAPPPPYSPPQNRVGSHLNENSIVSPADATYSSYSSANPSQVNTPTSAAGVMTPGTTRDSMVVPTTTVSTMQMPPPPPRGLEARRIASAGRARPMSVSALSQVVTQPYPYAHSQLSRPSFPDDSIEPQPPAARRAASAGAVSNASSSVTSIVPSESGSTRHDWRAGGVLPGPPPGPPPAGSRSHSASSSIESYSKPSSGVARHSQAYRVPLRAPLLSPMPPTPAGWTEDQPMHSMTRPVPLHVETANLDNAQAGHRQQSDPAFDTASRTTGSLARSSAVRDSSIKGIRERRSLRKSISDPDATTIASLMVDTNPWSASLRSKAIVKSPGQLSDSHVEMEKLKGLDKAIEAERPSSSRSASFSRRPGITASPVYAHQLRSPRSPVVRMHKLQTGNIHAQGGRALPTPPLSQNAPASAQSTLPSCNASLPDFDSATGDDFGSISLKRHKNFLEKEAQATTDEERLQFYADYLVADSVLRLKHYSGARQVDLLRIRQRIFDENDPAALKVLQAGRDEGSAVNGPESSRARPETMWWKDYQPALSPIASMSNDEMSSRGRASSRWWESQTGSQGDGGHVRRSKRESKYMGLSTTLINSMIEENSTPTNIPNSASMLGPDEYPEEKATPDTFGMYDEERHPSQNSGTIHGSPRLMDISRFITLPPPYPRHYPAVNNCHPQLSEYRLTVRSLSDLSEIKNRKSRQQISTEALRNEHEQRIAEGRKTFRSNIQTQIAEGSISYSEAAEAEAALLVDEHKAEKKALQAEFDTLQDVVINPLHDMLNDRLVQLNKSIRELSEKIRFDAQEDNPDRPQQEGDDTPELLEYLTQLKWLFETRETVQKEIFELLTMRNDKYKDIVVLPYRQAGHNDKVRETEAFFTRDSQDRRRAFCDESLQRQQQLYQIVEENVAHGVELQSSAFWDIAPNLMELLHMLSAAGDVDQWNHLEISESEYLENPSYYRFPQQYLYSLLDHAEKSTYQFIEGQVNLHCLLHEVKTGRLMAECRKAEVGGDDPVGWENYREKQEAVLTSELKQKVGMIEEQWAEALGNALQSTRERVRTWLEERGGWEEISSGE